MKHFVYAGLVLLLLVGFTGGLRAEDPPKEEPPAPAWKADVEAAKGEAKINGDTAWMLASSALVMLMVPGLALFYGGMVRRKNVLATMMQSMVALAIVGVFWIVAGYSIAFGDTHGGWFGWSWNLFLLKGVESTDMLANTNIPVYVHVMFQGMFAIITPALISGAIAERIKFGPYCLFILLWVALVYCPLAHWVWAMNWWDMDPTGKVAAADAGKNMVGFLANKELLGTMVLGKDHAVGAIDFAGGTVVHIAAGLSGLACILVLRKRLGYPEHAMHPNSMVLTLTGAGLLWFGWFGFNGGSAVGSGTLSSSAFSATQAAAAAAGLSWMVAEWLHKGKPTALGLASGIVAGLVAVTPASGYVYIWGGLAIGLIAGVVCYAAVCLKPVFKYDDSLDAFGVHGVGGFLGAVLTGVFCYLTINSAGGDGVMAVLYPKVLPEGSPAPAAPPRLFDQLTIQFLAACVSVVYTFVATLVLVKLVDATLGFTTDNKSETAGLDQTEHGEVGFDLSLAMEQATVPHEPRSASRPPNGLKRFSIVVEGASEEELVHGWSDLCQVGDKPPTAEFKAVYPNLTTIQGNRFNFRGGDPLAMSANLQQLLKQATRKNGIRATVVS